jgi:hypothetical protein
MPASLARFRFNHSRDKNASDLNSLQVGQASAPVMMGERPRLHRLLYLRVKRNGRPAARQDWWARGRKLAQLDRQERLSYSFKP